MDLKKGEAAGLGITRLVQPHGLAASDGRLGSHYCSLSIVRDRATVVAMSTGDPNFGLVADHPYHHVGYPHGPPGGHHGLGMGPASMNMNMSVSVPNHHSLGGHLHHGLHNGGLSPAASTSGGGTDIHSVSVDTDDFMKSNNRFTDLLSSVLSPDEDEDVGEVTVDFEAAAACGPVDLSTLDGLHLDFPMNSNSSGFSHNFSAGIIILLSCTLL